MSLRVPDLGAPRYKRAQNKSSLSAGKTSSTSPTSSQGGSVCLSKCCPCLLHSAARRVGAAAPLKGNCQLSLRHCLCMHATRPEYEASAGDLALQSPKADRIRGRHADCSSNNVAERHRQQVAEEEGRPGHWSAQGHALHGRNSAVSPPLQSLMVSVSTKINPETVRTCLCTSVRVRSVHCDVDAATNDGL